MSGDDVLVDHAADAFRHQFHRVEQFAGHRVFGGEGQRRCGEHDEGHSQRDESPPQAKQRHRRRGRRLGLQRLAYIGQVPRPDVGADFDTKGRPQPSHVRGAWRHAVTAVPRASRRRSLRSALSVAAYTAVRFEPTTRAVSWPLIPTTWRRISRVC